MSQEKNNDKMEKYFAIGDMFRTVSLIGAFALLVYLVFENSASKTDECAENKIRKESVFTDYEYCTTPKNYCKNLCFEHLREAAYLMDFKSQWKNDTISRECQSKCIDAYETN